MNRKRRTFILAEGNRELAAELAGQIESSHPVTVLEQPNNGLVMVKMRESAKRSLFYLGEVFVTECKVRVGESVGLGVVRGHEPELAYQLAVIDAAYQANLEETERWIGPLIREEQVIAGRREAEQRKVLKTKVNFETMDDAD